MSDSLLLALVSPAFGAEADTFTLPTDVPEKVIPNRPPIGAPPEVRTALARWFYIVAYQKGAWNEAAKAVWTKIRTLRIQYYGPQGWSKQPGWLDLAQRAERELVQGGMPPEVQTAFNATVDRWIADWNTEYAAASYSDRVAIGQAWQASYVTPVVSQAQTDTGARVVAPDYAPDSRRPKTDPTAPDYVQMVKYGVVGLGIVATVYLVGPAIRAASTSTASALAVGQERNLQRRKLLRDLGA